LVEACLSVNLYTDRSGTIAACTVAVPIVPLGAQHTATIGLESLQERYPRPPADDQRRKGLIEDDSVLARQMGVESVFASIFFIDKEIGHVFQLAMRDESDVARFRPHLLCQVGNQFGDLTLFAWECGELGIQDYREI
jgi:hypothetical protein